MKNILNLYQKRSFDYKTCFLCGCKLNTKNSSLEHVFPKWLQKDFNLFSQNLNLLNRTSIRYNQLKIPCCKNCNNKYLSKLENRIKTALKQGYSAFLKLNSYDISIWMIKIFYGILYRELFLKFDRPSGAEQTIIDPKLIKKFDMLHIFLQSVRIKIRFADSTPFSLKIFKLEKDCDPQYNFDYRDCFSNVWVIRMNDIGVILSHDHGLLGKHLDKTYPNLDKKQLSVLQFLEVVSKFIYKSMILNISINYIMVEGKKELVIMSTVRTYPEKWEDKNYAKVLAFHTGPLFTSSYKVAYKTIYKRSQGVRSWL